MWDKLGRKLTKVLIIEEVSENLINSSNAKTEYATDRVTKKDKTSVTKDRVNQAF